MYLFVVLEVVEAEPEPGISLPKLLVPSANGQEALLLQQLGSWAWQGEGLLRVRSRHQTSKPGSRVSLHTGHCSDPDLV